MEKWYVYKCPPGRELSMQTLVQQGFGATTYVPTKKVRRRDRNGRFAWVAQCALSGYLFVWVDKQTLFDIPRRFIPLRILYTREDGMIAPAVIPDHEMKNFQMTVSAHGQQVKFLSPDDTALQTAFREGDRVRIVEGPFVGVEGVFVQLSNKHEKRVIVRLGKLAAVATTAIPARMVEKI